MSLVTSLEGKKGQGQERISTVLYSNSFRRSRYHYLGQGGFISTTVAKEATSARVERPFPLGMERPFLLAKKTSEFRDSMGLQV
jgi:hypothetical protein